MSMSSRTKTLVWVGVAIAAVLLTIAGWMFTKGINSDVITYPTPFPPASTATAPAARPSS